MEDKTRDLFEALEAAPQGVVYWDADGCLVMCNDKFREMHSHIADILKPGLKIEELLRRQNESGLRTVDKQESVAWYDNEIELRKRKNIPDVIVKYGYMWVQVSRKKLADGSIIAFHTDITEVKTNEERFRKIFQSSPALVSISTVEESIILDVNDVWLKSLGYEKSEVIGKTPFDLDILVDPNERRRTARRLDQHHHTITEAQYKTKSGEFRDLLVSGEHIEFEGQDCFLFISQDITDRNRANRALRESEEHFRRVFEDAGVGMAMTEVDGRFRRVNDALSVMLGYSIEELLTMSVHDITHPEDLPSTVSGRDNIVSERIKQDTVQKRYIRKDGEIVWGSLTRSAMRDGNGDVQYFVSQVQDITERKKAEEQVLLRESKLSNAQELVNLGYFEHDLTTGRNFWSEILCRIFGVEYGAERKLEDYGALVHPDDRGSVYPASLKTMLRQREIIRRSIE